MKEFLSHTMLSTGCVIISGDQDCFDIESSLEVKDHHLLKVNERWRTKSELIEYLDGIKKIIQERI